MADSDELYVGLMSGTSLDGIDAALLDLSGAPRLIAAETFPIPADLQRELTALCQCGDREIERMGRADRQLGIAFGQAVLQLLKAADTAPTRIRAIGSHGQTIRHRPPAATENHPFTLQIADPSSIAEITGITTVADFRRRDIAAGGHGAPLVPAFHHAVFDAASARAVINIGGIANITAWPAGGAVRGFDIGPGNTLLDHWIQHHYGERFDRDGAWSAQGQVDPSLLRALRGDPYFAAAAPKSTGREYFNGAWLDRHLAGRSLRAVDVQATLLELTAQTIADTIAALPFAVDAVFICGGGALNSRLMTRLAALLQPRVVRSTAQLGLGPEWVEAAAFAWLAQQTLRGNPGNEPAVTGARGYRTLGAIYPA